MAIKQLFIEFGHFIPMSYTDFNKIRSQSEVQGTQQKEKKYIYIYICICYSDVKYDSVGL